MKVYKDSSRVLRMNRTQYDKGAKCTSGLLLDWLMHFCKPRINISSTGLLLPPWNLIWWYWMNWILSLIHQTAFRCSLPFVPRLTGGCPWSSPQTWNLLVGYKFWRLTPDRSITWSFGPSCPYYGVVRWVVPFSPMYNRIMKYISPFSILIRYQIGYKINSQYP